MENKTVFWKNVLIAATILLFSAGTASAVPISGYNGNEGLGLFEGFFSFTSEDDNNAVIDVSLINTSPVDNGGYLTAFAFLFPEQGEYNHVSLLGDNDNFKLIGLGESIQGTSNTFFDLGASTTKTGQGYVWLGGQGAGSGLGVGQAGNFRFYLTGSGYSGLTVQSFIDEGDPWFAARFMGFDDGGSDSVPAQQVPEPAVMVLMGVGLFGIGLFCRRYNNRSAIHG